MTAHRYPLVLGYPRSGFSLLINVLGELIATTSQPPGTSAALMRLCDTVGDRLAQSLVTLLEERGLGSRLIYNGNFRQLVGGPKWIRPEYPERACFRKYIGIQGMADFTLITSHPRKVLDYYGICHSHVGPRLWAEHPAYREHVRFASVRDPAGTVASACFSFNALASEYIQRFVPASADNDRLRQDIALYKLSDLNFFEALLIPFRAYMEEFGAYRHAYQVMRWEELIERPLQTIMGLGESLGAPVSPEQAAAIWRKLDHVNLTGHHKHNLRQGHGKVGGWKQWLTNTHLDMLRDYGLDTLSAPFGYGPIPRLDESAYTPFQQTVAAAIRAGRILRDYHDEDLFGFSFNKSNVDISRFNFRRYEWRTHTQVERSSCPDENLVMAVWDKAEAVAGLLNDGLDLWFSADDEPSRQRATLPDLCRRLTPLIDDPADWQRQMEAAITQDEGIAPTPEVQPAPPRLLGALGKTNLVEYQQRYYGLPQSLGPIDFAHQEVSKLPGVRVCDTLDELTHLLQGEAR